MLLHDGSVIYCIIMGYLKMTPPMIYVLYYCQIGFKIFKMEIQPAKIGLFNPIIMTKSKGIWGLAENDLENAWNMLEL